MFVWSRASNSLLELRVLLYTPERVGRVLLILAAPLVLVRLLRLALRLVG